jgi:hypothetical protein
VPGDDVRDSAALAGVALLVADRADDREPGTALGDLVEVPAVVEVVVLPIAAGVKNASRNGPAA